VFRFFDHHRFLQHRSGFGFFGSSAIVAFYSIGQDIGFFGFRHHRFLQHRRRILAFITLRPFGFSSDKISKRIGCLKFKEKLTDIGLFLVFHKHWIRNFWFFLDFG